VILSTIVDELLRNMRPISIEDQDPVSAFSAVLDESVEVLKPRECKLVVSESGVGARK